MTGFVGEPRDYEQKPITELPFGTAYAKQRFHDLLHSYANLLTQAKESMTTGRGIYRVIRA
ncbi:hypothetical protein DFO67_103150 [Modicisalibacter xianhensis]|uniref:Uncharacterized protein n=1 Tax=Modicisalibacter xianhensis TaxID=442341 RepID=A0A4R8G816_9GAMM|nr:hypothetical protein DFO67_103150 [Halomonas xianhensis]